MADPALYRAAIRTLLDEGYSISDVAEKTNTSESTVKRWKRAFAAGRNSVEDKPRSGKPPKVTHRVRRRILSACKGQTTDGKRKASTREIAKKVGLCKETVRTVLKSADLSFFRRPKVSKISEAGRRKRVAFAKKYLTADWRHTLTTDEKDIELALA